MQSLSAPVASSPVLIGARSNVADREDALLLLAPSSPLASSVWSINALRPRIEAGNNHFKLSVTTDKCKPPTAGRRPTLVVIYTVWPS